MRLRSVIKSAVLNRCNGHGRRMALEARRATAFAPEAQRSASRFAGKPWAVFLATLYPLLCIAPLATFVAVNPQSDHPRAAEAGVDCAVVGFTILALQFVITARLSWVEAPFGLDLLLMFHRAMALVALALLCAHPVLVASAHAWPLLTRLRVHWYIWAGRAALLLLLLHVSISLLRRVLRLSYERWRRLHNLFALAILSLGFAHSLAVGDDLRNGGMWVWAPMMSIALACWLYSRIVRPWFLLRHSFRVMSVKPETPRVWTLTLRSPENRPFHFVPGQFQFLRLRGAQISSKEHPFTIASSPTRACCISLTVKESGDFTSTLSRVRPGDRATVHGPFGRFSHVLHRGAGGEEEELIFVAAGVGITPLMSMLRYMRDRREPRRVLLVYANRRPGGCPVPGRTERDGSGRRPVAQGHPYLFRRPAPVHGPDWTTRRRPSRGALWRNRGLRLLPVLPASHDGRADPRLAKHGRQSASNSCRLLFAMTPHT
jgi:predicted ferric reductase